jgi:hypothetical protein
MIPVPSISRGSARPIRWLACLLLGFTHLAAASDAQLPDGSQFVFWEQPLEFSKTYYVDGNAPNANDNGPGTREQPFRTINKAAEVLQPGERVVIASGVYRELVRPARGGTGPDKMISYEAAPGATVVITGSEVLSDGWQRSNEPLREGAGAVIWKHELPSSLFIDAYNPFGMANVPSDWSWLDTKRVDMGPYFRRRGLIFVDGKPLEPVEQYRELGNVPLYTPEQAAAMQARRTGLPTRMRGGPIMQEIGGTPDGRFWVEHQGNVVHVRVPGDDIAGKLVEVTAREQVFAPREQGLGYIRLKGLIFRHAGNGFPPPQRGLVSTGGGHHWIIEGNTIEWANGVALDIGAQHWSGSRHPLSGHSHIVRGNVIRYAGVEGIGGMGTTNTLVEDNLIEWIGWQDAERAWEAAAAKFHNARNLLFRRNVVRHIRHANAVWLDVGNSNSRITSNVLADVVSVSAAVHMEMSLEPNQIDNNIIWDVRNAEPGTPGQRGAAGSGIFLHSSQNQIVAHNLIGRCDNVGVWPALRPDRAGAGNGLDHKIYNNLFIGCGKGGIVFVDEQNFADGNVYASLPEQFGGLLNGDETRWLDLAAWRERGWDRNGKVLPLTVAFDPDRLTLTLDGLRAAPKLPLFNRIDTDFFGRKAGSTRLPGPFVKLPGSQQAVDPRAENARRAN